MTTRRRFALGILSGLATPALSLATEAEQIQVSLTGVKNLKGLVKAMKEAAGDRAPAKVNLKEVYGALAEAFLDNAHEAMARGMEMPAKLKRFIPERRTVFLPAFVLVPLWGVIFVFELAPFYTLVIASLAVMLVWIMAKADERRKAKLRAEANRPGASV